MVDRRIGGGIKVSGGFEEINWGVDMYFIKTKTDLQGGASYTIAGVGPVLSVPYALHAKRAETATGSGTYAEGTPVNIVASANPGWMFTGWTGDTDYVDNVTSSNATVTMPAKAFP